MPINCVYQNSSTTPIVILIYTIKLDNNNNNPTKRRMCITDNLNQQNVLQVQHHNM